MKSGFTRRREAAKKTFSIPGAKESVVTLQMRCFRFGLITLSRLRAFA
jgi:hypothetical protein